MKGTNGLQKILYLIILILGMYIVYKGARLLLGTPAVQETLDSGKVQRNLEDLALRTWMPGYTAAVENRDGGNWMAEWMKQVVPVYSYLAEGEAQKETEAGGTGDDPEVGRTAESSGNGAGDNSGTGATTEGAAAGGTGNGPAAGRTAESSGNGTEDSSGAGATTEGAAAGGTGDDPAAGGTAESSGNGTEDGSGTGATTEDPVASGTGNGQMAGKMGENPANQAGDDSGTGVITEGDGDHADESENAEVSGQAEAENIDAPAGGSDAEEKDTASGAEEDTEAAVEASGALVSDALREQLRDFNYLVGNYYTVDGGTVADAELLDADTLLDEDLSIEQNPDVPQILIYHTHSQETFADSEEGKVEDTIVGMGEVLAEELRSQYGYQVIHDTGVYDLVDGVLDRSASYDYARAAVEEILQEYPTIEVIIDLHRDGVDGQKFVTEIDGRPTSMIMFFNGISRDSLDQPIPWLQNPYTTQNLAFSLQLQLLAREKYPGFTRNIYLKAERFNLHLRPRSLLVEAGTQLNTVEEERNAMIPLADLLHQVLSK